MSKTLDGDHNFTKKHHLCDPTFIGYHGTNKENANKIMKEGVDPMKMGSSSGQARGPGFYVARKYEHAKDYSEGYATNVYETIITKKFTEDKIIPKNGDAGVPCVLEVYKGSYDKQESVRTIFDIQGSKKYITHGPESTDKTMHGEDEIRGKYPNGFNNHDTYSKRYERVIPPDEFNSLSFKIVDGETDLSMIGEMYNHTM